MRNKVEIYNYNRRIETILERIRNSEIDKKNKDAILEFHKDCLSRGLSKARAFKYLYTLENLAKLLAIPFEKATRDNICELVTKNEKQDYADWTKHDYKVILKVFYRFLKKTDEYPPEVKWIKATIRNGNILPDEVLTEDDVKKLVECATNIRDKAFILVLYESGCRVVSVFVRERDVLDAINFLKKHSFSNVIVTDAYYFDRVIP